MNQKIHNWLEVSLESLRLENPQTIHIDDLLEQKLNKNNVVELSAQAFLILAEIMKQKQLTAFPLLVIPMLVKNNQLSLAIPENLDALKDQLDDEPPSLYLMHQDSLRQLEVCEEYRHPLPFELIASPLINLYAYYREFRYEQARTNRWEFSRCIYVQPNPL